MISLFFCTLSVAPAQKERKEKRDGQLLALYLDWPRFCCRCNWEICSRHLQRACNWFWNTNAPFTTHNTHSPAPSAWNANTPVKLICSQPAKEACSKFSKRAKKWLIVKLLFCGASDQPDHHVGGGRRPALRGAGGGWADGGPRPPPGAYSSYRLVRFWRGWRRPATVASTPTTPRYVYLYMRDGCFQSGGIYSTVGMKTNPLI